MTSLVGADLGADGRLYFSTHRGSSNVRSIRYNVNGTLWINICIRNDGEVVNLGAL